eukprot:11203106-Lingulodinium_polyedra.AAC.1
MEAIESKLEEKTDSNFWECIWKPGGILDHMPTNTQQSLTGNGMHLAVAGVVISWTLGNAVP